jgi:vacuolar-type H+-ATPase subunit B/Vma2
MGLKVEIMKIFMDNMKKTNATRKSNCIINTGDNPTKEERKRRILEN